MIWTKNTDLELAASIPQEQADLRGGVASAYVYHDSGVPGVWCWHVKVGNITLKTGRHHILEKAKERAEAALWDHAEKLREDLMPEISPSELELEGRA